MNMSTNLLGTKPTAFDELRYGYFPVAFGNILKAIRGGTNPIGVTTLAMCAVAALSQIQWSINNQQMLESNGELKEMDNNQKKALNYSDKKTFEAWLNKWVKHSGINGDCDAPRVYGLRCALVHTGGGSSALSKTGVKAWYITANASADHYSVQQKPSDVLRFYLDMPDFLAELMLASDRFLNDQKNVLETASSELRLSIGHIAGLSSVDHNGVVTSRLINNVGSLSWFDERLSETPLQITKGELAAKIRAAYDSVKHLVLQ